MQKCLLIMNVMTDNLFIDPDVKILVIRNGTVNISALTNWRCR